MGKKMLLSPESSTLKFNFPVRRGEGEFVCTHCEEIVVAVGKPQTCKACGDEHFETLTLPAL